MQPVASLTPAEARRLSGLLFDLDDTLLDHGKLGEAAYSALFRLREAGLALYAVTGRPAGWGAVIAHQWPIAGAVTENGAIAHVADEQGLHQIDWVGSEERARRSARLRELCGELVREFPELRPSDDVSLRISDYTFDIGEHQQLPRERVRAVAAAAQARGARTIASSVHLHVSFDRADKASGVVGLIHKQSGTDPSSALVRYAFIGDSENDASCFAAFRTTIGVANLSGRATLLPRFSTVHERGAGFAEAAAALIDARRRPG